MPMTLAAINELPVPVRIFRAAMEQQRSLADYARSLGISDASLRATVTAQLDQVEPDALDRLADLYHQPREVLSEQVSRPITQETFADWLKRNMEGVTQHGLRTRAQLDYKTLKQFLNGGMLPDSDQCERLARALYIDRTEVARVVTATMIDRAIGAQKNTAGRAPAAEAPPSPDIAGEPLAARPARARRPKATPNGEPASVEATAASPTTAPEEQSAVAPLRARRPKNTADSESASIKATADSPTSAAGDQAGEPDAEPTASAAVRPSARRQASPKIVALPSSATATLQAETPEPAPRPVRPAAARQASTATGTASERTGDDPVSAPVHQDTAGEMAAEAERAPAAKVPAQRSTRQQRRSEAAKLAAADTGAPSAGERATEALNSQDAAERNPAADLKPAADLTPVADSAPTAEPAAKTASPALADQSAPADPSSDTPMAPAARPAPPARRAKPTPPAAGATVAPAESTQPVIQATSTTPLELTADELRLIRHWRQLHPHGRRATLHYIGSLLVED